jgi:hypothetical protein
MKAAEAGILLFALNPDPHEQENKYRNQLKESYFPLNISYKWRVCFLNNYKSRIL